MQIVIDIPEQRYKWIVENPLVYTTELDEAVRKGTPLPEHHGRLIDISKVEFLDISPIRAYDKGWHNAVRLCVETLRDAPTVLEATKEGDEE